MNPKQDTAALCLASAVDVDLQEKWMITAEAMLRACATEDQPQPKGKQ